jgi:MFS family permease
MASLMLTGGRLQNILGRKRTFLTGAGIYGVGTVVAALSINSTMLLIGWSILEGIGAALMMPASTSIISGSYKGEKSFCSGDYQFHGIWCRYFRAL